MLKISQSEIYLYIQYIIGDIKILQKLARKNAVLKPEGYWTTGSPRLFLALRHDSSLDSLFKENLTPRAELKLLYSKKIRKEIKELPLYSRQEEEVKFFKEHSPFLDGDNEKEFDMSYPKSTRKVLLGTELRPCSLETGIDSFVGVN